METEKTVPNKNKDRETYCYREFLNSPTSASTGSVVCYAGPASWEPTKREYFLEVADCHVKARLHRAKGDTAQMYIRKIRKLRDALTEYLDFLYEDKLIELGIAGHPELDSDPFFD